MFSLKRERPAIVRGHPPPPTPSRGKAPKMSEGSGNDQDQADRNDNRSPTARQALSLSDSRDSWLTSKAAQNQAKYYSCYLMVADQRPHREGADNRYEQSVMSTLAKATARHVENAVPHGYSPYADHAAIVTFHLRSGTPTAFATRLLGAHRIAHWAVSQLSWCRIGASGEIRPRSDIRSRNLLASSR
jgi:hypothetical protein